MEIILAHLGLINTTLVSPNGTVQGSLIPVGTTVTSNTYAASPNNQYILVMQNDGDLALYQTYGGASTLSSPALLWHTNTSVSESYYVVQPDGNLVVYSPTGTVQWASGSSSPWVFGLCIQDDGNVVLYGLTNFHSMP